MKKAEKLVKILALVEDTFAYLGKSKKDMVGTVVELDEHAQHFPGAYRGVPESTQFKAEYSKSGWRAYPYRGTCGKAALWVKHPAINNINEVVQVVKQLKESQQELANRAATGALVEEIYNQISTMPDEEMVRVAGAWEYLFYRITPIREVLLKELIKVFAPHHYTSDYALSLANRLYNKITGRGV